MDVLTSKTHTTTRGLTYAYHTALAAPGKPTLLFLHGFPSSSWDWTHQVAHFAPKGYGLVVPDMLGYGGTDKPTDAALTCRGSSSSHTTGGSRVASRVLNLFPLRVTAVAFLSVGYVAPNPSFDYLGDSAVIRERFGRDFFGYWEFFSEDGADEVIEEHNPPPPYATPDVIAHYKTALLQGGMAAPLKWYTVNTAGLNSKDDALVPDAYYSFAQPVFFGGTAKDAISLPAVGLAALKAHAKGPLTYREFDSDHWIMLSHSERLNNELDEWIAGLGANCKTEQDRAQLFILIHFRLPKAIKRHRSKLGRLQFLHPFWSDETPRDVQRYLREPLNLLPPFKPLHKDVATVPANPEGPALNIGLREGDFLYTEVLKFGQRHGAHERAKSERVAAFEPGLSDLGATFEDAAPTTSGKNRTLEVYCLCVDGMDGVQRYGIAERDHGIFFLISGWKHEA
ncbi:hypothetical protein EWM64_g7418 [Hericium alpestre]|uniref:AB hydrolase-1 domain-containing protein n=1 Tax=Hericium alpestre TaxID=135208 RepID=A0A4Y9ZNZ3_9AGAM|nr:hypothetical protein EWM64_g7418 [Hericium alpestre]